MLWLRRWAVNKFGEDSGLTYLVHCSACSSIWLSFPAAIGWAMLTLPLRLWWIAAPAWFALSYIAILLKHLEGGE
jgi:hypothetical protein